MKPHLNIIIHKNKNMLFFPSLIFIQVVIIPFLQLLFFIPQATRFHWVYNIFSFTYQHIIGMSISYDETFQLDLESLGSKIFVISNHPGYTDFLNFVCFHQRYFSTTHEAIFVTIPKFSKFPFIGKYFLKNPHFTLYNGISKEELEDLKKYLENYPRPFVLYMMPEGSTYIDLKIEQSKKTEIGKHLKHLIYPRTKAFLHFYPLVDSVIDLTFCYKGAKAPYLGPCIMGQYPHSLYIHIENQTNFLFQQKNCIKKALESIWLKKDKILINFRTKEKDDLVEETDFPLFFPLGLSFLYLFFPMLSLYLKDFYLFGLTIIFWIFFLESFFWKRHFWMNKLTGLLLYAYLIWLHQPVWIIPLLFHSNLQQGQKHWNLQ